jgi:4-hydroxy-3-polyprenylbenzoate decarboxylase
MEPYESLRDYLDTLEAHGLLTRVARRVDKDGELVPLVRLQFRGLPASERRAFLFDDVTDARGRTFDASVAIASLAASREIYALAVGASEGTGGVGEAWARALGNPVAPVRVRSGPCKEVVVRGAEELDRSGGVDMLPHPISTPGFDPAPFLTAGCWVTRDPDDGSYNVGTYRGMIKGARRVGLQMDTPSQHIAIQLARARRRGQPLPVAIVLGAVPALSLASVQKLPYGTSEYELAGGLMGRPLDVVPAETVDLEVPAQAEVVIEGHIDPFREEREGPFGEASGYMGPSTSSPVVEVSCVTHRRRPIVQAFISEFPPSESTLMRKIGFENVYLRHLRDACNIATVRRVTFYESASSNMSITVQLEEPTPGQAWQALYAVAGYEPSMGKLITAVDADVDPEDLDAVLWALSYRTQPAADVQILQGRVPRLDPSMPAGTTAPAASTLLVDATRGRPYPPTSLPGRPHMERALALWEELGLPALQLRSPWHGQELGDWDDDSRTEAGLAVAGRYLETGARRAVPPDRDRD